MGAILDTNVVPEVFGRNRPEAGKKFFDWINEGAGKLVVGGKLLEELERTPAREWIWIRQGILSTSVRMENEVKVKAYTKKLQNKGGFKSDDPHILALAQVSGARLLYSNDSDLHKDFKNSELINRPGGRVYSTIRGNGKIQKRHKGLLRLKKKDLCGTPR